MKTVFYSASTRGSADFGWLKAKHSFSFGQWHNPEQMHFGALRVLNDDIVKGGSGFGTHPHDNMEIVTIPLKGAIAHKDSTGGNGVIQAGDVQIMSAGSGVTHSEFNASKTEEVNLLQIWVFPKNRNIAPRYDQRNFGATRVRNEWQVVVSPDEADGGLWVNQETIFSILDADAEKTFSYHKKFATSGVYFFVIEGSIALNGTLLQKRDAIGISETEEVSFTTHLPATLLAIEVPMLK